MKGPGTLPKKRKPRPWNDHGQAVIEFTGVVPLILVTLILLWQAALVGYTFSLAGNAADKAVHAAAATDSGDRDAACEAAGREDLPAAWDESATIECFADGDLVKAEFTLTVPVLFPGGLNFPFDVQGRSAAARES
ncbi:TadE/TadG family type IV pilus assembly protein [Streptomyces sp. AK02-01A]|uniref:TadE/TadG family type IV pilus assembly protein n=1 Tax=Streptomyces sp. AK02-01A TaxID=3028648 RepID=UPI0029B477C1|nr:TadE/TadG family type IV pilus assembly protein [Streptomyces sp. AK02-01A]MDX3851677.1 pilus assembly protein [Streptomyces sp. AK02-01A]